MDTIRQAVPQGASERVSALEQNKAQLPAAAASTSNRTAQAATAAAAPPSGASPAAARPLVQAPKPSGFSLMAAFASVGARNSMVTDIVFGPGNQVAQIRVVDAVTHQVISTSPPDSIAHMQLEVQQYQDAAKNKLGTT